MPAPELWACVLEQEPTGARLQCAVDVLVEIEGGDDDDGYWVIDAGSGKLTGGFEAVHVRHPDVEKAYVGTELAGERDRLVPVRSLTDDLDVGLGVEDRLEAALARL